MYPLRLLALSSLLTFPGCATTSGALGSAKECESFAEVDAAVRAELDTLLASAPGERLVRESSRLNGLRRACARHRIARWPELREERGLDEVSVEVAALSAAYTPRELEGLVAEQLGPAAEDLKALLKEAALRQERERAAPGLAKRDDSMLAALAVTGPSRIGPEPQLPDTLCHEQSACAQLRCVAREGGNTDVAARPCLDEVGRLPVKQRPAELARVLSLLAPGVSGARTEATLALEQLRASQWGDVERASTSGKHGLAAQLALPFGALPAWAAKVDALRARAREHHTARARAEKQADAQWLHQGLAQSFGADAVEVEAPAGRWDPTRWRCEPPAPELPTLHPGLRALLSVQCPRAAQAPESAKSDTDAMRTFELEKELLARRVTASLRVECAGKVNSYDLHPEDREALGRELQRALDEALHVCVRVHTLAASADCTQLRTLGKEQLIARFVEHARYAQRWEPCFADWLVAEEGAAPPPLPPAVKGTPSLLDSLLTE